MALNQVFKFVDVLSLPVPEGRESGNPVLLNADIGLVGVLLTDRGTRDDFGADSYDDPWGGGNATGHASVALAGAFRLPVTGALTILQPVYITEAHALTATAGENVRFGWALTTKGAGLGDVTVVIDGAPGAEPDDG